MMMIQQIKNLIDFISITAEEKEAHAMYNKLEKRDP